MKISVAANDESHDFKPEPIVCSIPMSELKKLNLDFQPDWGGHGVTEETTWEETYKEFGSFSVYGDIDSIKKHFEIKDISEI